MLIKFNERKDVGMSHSLIEKLSNAFGVSGFEGEVSEVVREFAKDFSTIETDKMGNVSLKYEGASNKSVNVLLDAHMDEVGFIVQAIRPNGMLEFLPVGGWVVNNVPAHTVIIRTEDNTKIKGITASTPPHFMSEAEKNSPLTMDALVIDVGTSSKEETEALGIQIGDPVVPDVKFETLHNDSILLGKAFDCRIGCACLLETMKEFQAESENYDVNLEGVLSTQEEVGLRGAQVVANRTDADIAIVFEGCPADDTFTPDYKIQSALKNGPMLRDFDVSMITHPGFQKFALNLAKKYGIKVQRSVRKGGGTNGSAYHLANKGIPTIVIGIPVRYAHTHYGYVAYEDFESAKELALAILKEMDQGTFDQL